MSVNEMEPADVFHLDQLPLASARLHKNDNAEWFIIWQNETAESLWQHYDVNEDFNLKLSLMDAQTRATPTSFTHKLEFAIQPFRFIATPYEDDILLQFFPDQFVQRAVDKKDANIYELVVETSGQGIFDLDLIDNKIAYTAKAYEVCELDHSSLGNSKEIFLSRIHPHDVENFIESMEMHLETSWPFKVDFRFRVESGDYIWLQSCGKAIRDEMHDIPLRFVANLVNISERKFTEHLAEEREKLVEHIIDDLPISIFVKDEHGGYRFFNRESELQSGLERNKVIGKTGYEIFPIDIARQQAQQDQDALASDELIVEEEYVEIEGQPNRWFLVGKGALDIQIGNEVKDWILGFSLDITQRKLAEEALLIAKDEAEKATRTKSDFLSVMSHEIRTPLNSIIGSSQLVLDTELDKEQMQYAELIQRSGEHLLYLINDILDFSKLEAKKMQLESRPFDLKKQIETAVSISKVPAGIKHLELSVHIEASLPNYFLGDAARIRQILLNLIGNAVKFTTKGGVSVKVFTTQSGMVRHEVMDSGIGIKPENIGKLFQEFTQADASTTRNFGGTGLGLSICKKLVEMMEGQIGIDSEFGHGSTFWFELPLKSVADDEVKISGDKNIPELTRSLKILIAEDNPSNQLLIRAILNKLGHKIEIVDNGALALEAVKSNEYDLVLMDMQMPEMDGLTATGKIRELDHKNANIPIIALTANALDGDRDKVLESGMSDYLSKPIDIGALKTALKVWGSHAW